MPTNAHLDGEGLQILNHPQQKNQSQRSQLMRRLPFWAMQTEPLFYQEDCAKPLLAKSSWQGPCVSQALPGYHRMVVLSSEVACFGVVGCHFERQISVVTSLVAPTLYGTSCRAAAAFENTYLGTCRS